MAKSNVALLREQNEVLCARLEAAKTAYRALRAENEVLTAKLRGQIYRGNRLAARASVQSESAVC